MTLRLELTRRAAADRDVCFGYISARSPQGAARWLDAFESAVNSLLDGTEYGLAPESEDHDEPIFQKFFRTRSGYTYRLLYLQRGNTIYVIHVRGTGQELVSADDLELPEV
ncbi:MAG: type II toxin-antitoxin system RelE/ParE family toxin [Planctomycetota bacterium]